MFGYIYLTTNNVNEKVYVGQHKSYAYDPSYLGSGKALRRAIDKYGKSNFSNIVLDTAETQEELNKKEEKYVTEYKEKYGTNCYNIADGGHGHTRKYQSEEEHQAFIEKMTKINRERCSTAEFKAKISKASTERYKDPKEREKHSIREKATWADKDLRKRQSEKLTEYFADHPKDNSYLDKKCIFELNGEKIEFKSVKALRAYLINVHNYNPDRRSFKKIMEDSAKGIAFNPFHKNKFGHLIGMRIYYAEEE